MRKKEREWKVEDLKSRMMLWFLLGQLQMVLEMTMLKNVGPGNREDYEMDFGHFEIQVAMGNKNKDFGGYSSELEEIFKSHGHLDVIKIMGVDEFTKEDRTLR